ncbi:MAG: ATP-dependent DNA ligase [Polyangiales bacterium]
MTALSLLAETSERLARTPKRGEKRALLVDTLMACDPTERGLCASYLAGMLRQPKLGVGHAQLYGLRSLPPSAASTLTVAAVDGSLEAVAATSGAGSVARRLALLTDVFTRASALEQRFLVGLVLGELRQGAVESLVVDAVAVAAKVPNAVLRRALMLSGELSHVTELAFSEGEAALAAVQLTLFRPIMPMLAEPAGDVASALAQLQRAIFEYKLDGARVQVHRRGSEVRVFTRTGNDVTSRLPEVTALVRDLSADEIVLDGEVLALYPDGSPQPFQETMRRFGRKLGVAEAQQALPLSVYFFDCLQCNGRTLLDAPTHERVEILTAVVPQPARVPRLITDDLAAASAFADAALGAGHEGVMAKAYAAPYAAGKRGSNWLKIKRAHTLDLVVLAAEWGSGRRVGSLSNLHLGALDEATGEYVMLGKTFKGLTDELLRFQTQALLEREVRRDEWTVYVRPELVVEIAVSDIQKSARYPGGFALRLARVKSYRSDKPATQASTLEEVRRLFAAQRMSESVDPNERESPEAPDD